MYDSKIMTNQNKEKGLELYGVTFRNVIDRIRYKGRGRPRKVDYITFEEVQKRINELKNRYLDFLKLQIK